MKRLYKLPPSTKLCNDFYVLDVETAWRRNSLKDNTNFTGTLQWQLKATPDAFIFGVIYGLNFTKVLYSVDEFKRELLLPRYHKRKVFAHNGGNYDYPCLYGNVFDTDPSAIFNGKFISFTNGNCTFVDSVNIFVGLSVKKIGEMIGKDKLGMSREYSKSVWPRDKARDINGCIRDCEIVWDALVAVFEFAGDIKITQASLSMTYYRRFHQPFHIDHNENTRFFWDSYYGGRTEAFKIGPTHASVIDVNSMYPAMMKKITFPNPKTLKYVSTMSVESLPRYVAWFEGCVNATIIHPRTRFGFLPLKKEGKLIFPTGRFTATWNFNELSFAIEFGGIKVEKIHYCVYGEKMVSPFERFVGHLQEMKFNAKLTGNLSEEDRAKRFSNSLYGKFGQRIDEEHIYIKDIEKQWDEIEDYQRKGLFVDLKPFNARRNDAFLVIKSGKIGDISYAIPSFASYITSAARVELLKKMLEYQDRKIVYCDTDSIFFEVMDDRVKSSNELGGWKIEDKIITEIKGLKNYRYVTTDKATSQRRLKGVPSDSGKTVTIFDVDGNVKKYPSVDEPSTDRFVYYNLLKTKEALKRGLQPGILTERIKVIKNTYDKRIVFQDGETKPIEL